MSRLRLRLDLAFAWAFAALLLSLSARSAQALPFAAALQAAARLHVPSGRAQLAHEATLRTCVPAPRASEHGLGGDRGGAADTRGGIPPAPNAAAPPGMCPGIVVEGGGGAGGGAGAGGGKGGKGKGGANDSGNGNDANGDAAGAP